jgi:branched-chain amino acid transport system substrate-binding protein
MGNSFIKQFANAGTDIPMKGPGFSFDQDVLPAVGDAALGAHNAAQWSPDLDNPANKAFVEAFEAEYDRLPSVYASQAYDTALLILSANAKADVADHDAYHAALKAADFPTVRGSFAFGNNQHPIQNFYAREVVKRDDGVITNRIVGTAFENHVDAYAAECPME